MNTFFHCLLTIHWNLVSDHIILKGVVSATLIGWIVYYFGILIGENWMKKVKTRKIHGIFILIPFPSYISFIQK